MVRRQTRAACAALDCASWSTDDASGTTPAVTGLADNPRSHPETRPRCPERLRRHSKQAQPRLLDRFADMNSCVTRAVARAPAPPFAAAPSTRRRVASAPGRVRWFGSDCTISASKALTASCPTSRSSSSNSLAALRASSAYWVFARSSLPCVTAEACLSVPPWVAMFTPFEPVMKNSSTRTCCARSAGRGGLVANLA